MAVAFARRAEGKRAAIGPMRARLSAPVDRPGTPLFLQRKALAIDPEESPLEREADAVAERIMRMPEGAALAAGGDGDGGGQPKPGGGADRAALGTPLPGPAVHAALGGGGSPLPDAVRTFFEPKLGADLSGVRVHTGSAAHTAASEIRAKAFTHGRDIYFGAGRYAPGTGEGRRLLAHELAHALQQGAGGLDLIQADFESDFAGRSEVRVADSPVRPPRTVRVTNAAGEEVYAPYGVYEPSEVPGRYRDRIMESTQAQVLRNPGKTMLQVFQQVDPEAANLNEVTVEHMRAYAKHQGPAVATRVVMARVGNDFRFLGYDTATFGTGLVHGGFVESAPGTVGVGATLFSDRVVRALQAGVPEMDVEVYTGKETAEFHAKIYKIIGRPGQPSEGEHYRLTPREMIRVVLAWSDELSASQRSQLVPLAAGGREPTPAEVERVLRGTPAPGRGGGTPPAAPPAAGRPSPAKGGAAGGGPSTAPPSKATGPTAPAAETGAEPKRGQAAPPVAGSGPTLGRQITFGLSYFAVMALLQYISALVMEKIEQSLFEKDWKALEPQIQTAVNQRRGEIAGLLKMKKRIYANVRMDALSNFVPNHNWQNPGGDWRYFTTKFIDAAIGTNDVNRPEAAYLDTVVTTLWMHRPFTYSFPLGDPIMVDDMPAGFQHILDHVASILIDIQRSTSIGGTRFAEINKHLHTSLQMLGETWENYWTETAAMTDAERFKVLKSAVDRTLTSMNTIFGTKPAGDERQMLAKLWIVKNQLAAMHDLWPLEFEEGTWHGSRSTP